MCANCILFATFCSMGTIVRRKKTYRYSARKVLEFSQLMADILVYESCKFEMYIIEIAQVIGEIVPLPFFMYCTEYIFSFHKCRHNIFFKKLSMQIVVKIATLSFTNRLTVLPKTILNSDCLDYHRREDFFSSNVF